MRSLFIKITLMVIVMFFSMTMLAKYHFSANNLGAKIPLVLRPVDALTSIYNKVLGTAKDKVDDVKTSAITQYNNALKTNDPQSVTQPPLTDHDPLLKNSEEWDSISNADKICWVHRKTRKMQCEQKSNMNN